MGVSDQEGVTYKIEFATKYNGDLGSWQPSSVGYGRTFSSWMAADQAIHDYCRGKRLDRDQYRIVKVSPPPDEWLVMFKSGPDKPFRDNHGGRKVFTRAAARDEVANIARLYHDPTNSRCFFFFLIGSSLSHLS